MLGVGRIRLGNNRVNGQQELDVAGFCLVHQFLGKRHALGVQQRIAHVIAQGLKERVRHAAADDEAIAPGQQVFDDADFIGHLGAAEDGHKRARGVFQRIAHDA